MTELAKKIRGGGPRTTALMSVAGALLLAAGAYFLWSVQPGRTYVSVGPHELSKAELDRYAQSRLKDAERRGIITPEQARNAETFEKYRREAAQMWIFRTVLLDEALRRRLKATPADEEAYGRELDGSLRRSGIYNSREEYFKSGVLPENEMRKRFREDILVYMLLNEEVASKVAEPTALEVEEARKSRRAAGLPDGRAEVAAAIREARYQTALRAYYLQLLRSVDVRPDGLVPTDAPRESSWNRASGLRGPRP